MNITSSNRYSEFGNKLREFREKSKESITQAAKSLNIDRSYLSKLENGHERPSLSNLHLIIKHYSLNPDDAYQLFSLLGYNERTGLTFIKSFNHNLVNMQENNSSLTGMGYSPLYINSNLNSVSGMNGGSGNVSDSNLNYSVPSATTGAQISMPQGLPVLYTDSVFISSSKYGIVFDFAQMFGLTQTTNSSLQNVVCRIGMSREHAKIMLNVLQNHLDNSHES